MNYFVNLYHKIKGFFIGFLMGIISLLAFQFLYILRIDWLRKAQDAYEFGSKNQISRDVELKVISSFQNPNYDYSKTKKDGLISIIKIDENALESQLPNNLESNDQIKLSCITKKQDQIIKFIICLSLFIVLCLSVYIHESNFVIIDLNSAYNITNNSNFNNLNVVYLRRFSLNNYTM